MTQYATDVTTGAIVAGRAVRLAGARHLNDLKRQKTEEFPYYWDPEAAQRVIDFFPTFLTLETGAAFNLPAWLQFSYGAIIGWKCWGGTKTERLKARFEELLAAAREMASTPEITEALKAADRKWRESDIWAPTAGKARHGFRKYQHGYFETSKGSGKTPSAGGLALYCAAFDNEDAAEIYSTGFDKGQASIILNDAIRMAETSPDDEFRAEFIVDKYNISHPASRSFIRAMSSQHQSKSGPRPHCVFSDEVHEHRDGTVVTKAEAGFKNRNQPLGLKYTNSGSDKTSYCWQLHAKSFDVLEGTVTDEGFFAYVCHLDPCDKCYAEGYRQPKDGCADCDDWTNPDVWPKIAPALGVVIQKKYLQDAIDKALTIPSEFSLVRRLNFCIWTETHRVWIQADDWDACRSDAVLKSNPLARPATVGIDLSSKYDLSAAVVAVRFDDGPGAPPPEEFEIEGRNLDGETVVSTITLNFIIELTPYFWIPKDTLLERVRKEHIPYDVWERSGDLMVTPGANIDHEVIYQTVIKEIVPTFKVRLVGYDDHDATMFARTLINRGRLGEERVKAVGQGKKLSEAFKLMQMLIRARRLRHNGNLVLAWNIANSEPQDDRLGALWLEKPAGNKRIDGSIASAVAIHQLMTLPARRPRSGGVFFV